MNKLITIACNLKMIRLKQHLSQREVAYAAGISLVAYSNIEHARTLPRDETIRRLAEVLDVSVDEIWKRDDLEENIRFRCSSRLILRNKLLSHTNDFVEMIRKTNYFKKQRKYFNAYRGLEPKEVSEQIRKDWEIDELPINGLLYLLEEQGINLLSCRAMSELFRSFSGYYEDIGPVIVFNSWEILTVENIIFNIAHELGHILMHPYVYDNYGSELDEKENREADEFATYFLMPQNTFLRIYDLYKNLNTIDKILAIKAYFNVSWKIVVDRINEIDVGATLSINDFTNILKENGYNLRIHPEVRALSRLALFKDGCKESFIPKIIIEGIKSNKISKSEVNAFYPLRDLNNALFNRKMRPRLLW